MCLDHGQIDNILDKGNCRNLNDLRPNVLLNSVLRALSDHLHTCLIHMCGHLPPLHDWHVIHSIKKIESVELQPFYGLSRWSAPSFCIITDTFSNLIVNSVLDGQEFLCVRDARILGGLTLCVVSGKLHKILAAVTFRPEVECLGFPRAGRVDEVHVHEREDAFTDLWSSASTFATHSLAYAACCPLTFVLSFCSTLVMTRHSAHPLFTAFMYATDSRLPSSTSSTESSVGCSLTLRMYRLFGSRLVSSSLC